MNATFPPIKSNRMQRLRDEAGHPYSRTCNCDECFETWLAMPPPSDEEKQRMAREFMAMVAPSSGGELVTDWPKVSFPDLDELAKGQRKFERDFGCEPARILK